jgi:translation elongation factor P/translation initiation factor 5A
MKKKAKDLKKGDKVSIGGEKLEIVTIEVSGIGKQGTQKCRIEASKSSGEKIVIIRPSDYPFDVA